MQLYKRKKRSPKKGFLILLILLLLLLVGWAGLHLWLIWQSDQKDIEAYQMLREVAVRSDTSSTASEVPDSAASSSEQDQHSDSLGYLSPINFEALWEINEDVVGWLRCEGTAIDYPIVQSQDNSYYLKRTMQHEWSNAGSLFLDYRNAGDFSDQQSVVFGHNFVRGDLMFTSLLNYSSQGYYEQHPTMTLYTPTAEYTVRLFSAYTLELYQYDLEFNYATPQKYETFLSQVQQQSDFISNVTPTAQDRILSLCTCGTEPQGERYLVHGVLEWAAGTEGTP